MKKKISLMLCFCFMVLTLTACGGAETTDYYGTSASELQTNAQSMVASLVASSDEDLSSAVTSNKEYAKQYAKQYGREYTEAEAVINLLETWLDASGEVGEYGGLGDFSIDQTSDTVTVDQIVHFSNRDVDVSFVYEYNYTSEELELTDATANVVYSMSEKMQKATLNTMLGMGIVFCVLLVMCGIIYCMKFISKIGGTEEKKPEEKKKPAPAQTAPTAQRMTAPRVAAPSAAADTELVAVIAAAIAANEGVSPDTFVVRSIHRR